LHDSAMFFRQAIGRGSICGINCARAAHNSGLLSPEPRPFVPRFISVATAATTMGLKMSWHSCARAGRTSSFVGHLVRTVLVACSTVGTTMVQEPLRVRSFGLTDRGLRRSTNEDQFLIAELTKTMRIIHTSLEGPSSLAAHGRGHLFLVADGMGGHNAGEQASALAVAVIEQFTLETLKWFRRGDEHGVDTPATEFEGAVRQADQAIVEAAADRADLHGMGTTLTLAFAVDARLFVLHVGDSRAYLFRQGTLRQLTDDHTLVSEMVRRGELAPDQTSQHRLRHVITNVVGGPQAGVRAETHTLDLQPDDILLLCTDGLTDMLSVEQIGGMLASGSSPQSICEQLIASANERGGHDNLTAIVAQFDAETEPPSSHAP
jgi:PPM family protein phosphatase